MTSVAITACPVAITACPVHVISDPPGPEVGLSHLLPQAPWPAAGAYHSCCCCHSCSWAPCWP